MSKSTKRYMIIVLSCILVFSCCFLIGCNQDEKPDPNPSGENTEEITDECQHEYDVKIIEATCTTPKKKIYTCKKCNHSYTETEGKALGHAGEWKVVQEATCSADGKEQRTCTRCGQVEERLIPPTPHHYVEDVSLREEPDCTTNGKQVFKCDNPGCNDSYEKVIFAPGHTPKGKGQVHQPTCTEKGYTVYRCSVCGEEYKDDIVNATGHKLVEGDRFEATCEHGAGTKYVCENAGCGYTEYVYTGQRLPHQFDENGRCKLCNKTVAELNPIEFSQTCYTADKIEKQPYSWICNYSEGEMNGAPKFDFIIRKDIVNEYVRNGCTEISIIFDRKTADQAVGFTVNGTSKNGSLYVNVPLEADKDLIIKDVSVYNLPDWVSSGDGWLAADGFKITLAFRYKYDFENPASYIEAGLPYIYNPTAKCYEANYLASYGYQDHVSTFTIKKEYLESLKEKGATTLMIRATGSGNVGIAKADPGATDISNRGGSVQLKTPFDLYNLPTDDAFLMDKDGNLTLKIYSSHDSHFKVFLINDDPTDPSNFIAAGLPYVYNEEEKCYEADYQANYGYQDHVSTFTIKKEYIDRLKAEGITKLMIRVTGSGNVGIAKADRNATDISNRGASVQLKTPFDLNNLPNDADLVDKDGNITLKIYSSADSHFRVYLEGISD